MSQISIKGGITQAALPARGAESYGVMAAFFLFLKAKKVLTNGDLYVFSTQRVLEVILDVEPNIRKR